MRLTTHTHISRALSGTALAAAQKQAEHIRKLSEQGIWPYSRVYYDAYSIYGKNIFGIEMPFHQSIGGEKLLETIESHIDINNLARAAMETLRKPVITFARIHANRLFKFKSLWHRDNTEANSKKRHAILMNIYLREEFGFEIIKPEAEGLIYPTPNKSDGPQFDRLNIAVPNKYISRIDAKAGDIVLFNPFLVHRGAVYGERLHLHLRIEEESVLAKQKLEMLDYKSLRLLKSAHPEFQITDGRLDARGNVIPSTSGKQSPLIRRLARTARYFTPWPRREFFDASKIDDRIRVDKWTHSMMILQPPKQGT